MEPLYIREGCYALWSGNGLNMLNDTLLRSTILQRFSNVLFMLSDFYSVKILKGDLKSDCVANKSTVQIIL